jgi:hypothetical protein
MRQIPTILLGSLGFLFIAACSEDAPSEPAIEKEVAWEANLPIPPIAQPEPYFRPHPVPPKDEPPKFDPLLVKNIDVTDPDRGEYIESLRAGFAADPEDEWVFEECRRLGKLKSDGQLDEYQSGLDALNARLRANDSRHTVADVSDSTITLVDETNRLTVVVPFPDAQPRGTRAPGNNPFPRGYMPPYGPRRK